MNKYYFLLLIPAALAAGIYLSRPKVVEYHEDDEPKRKQRQVFTGKRTLHPHPVVTPDTCDAIEDELSNIDFAIPIAEIVETFNFKNFANCRDPLLKDNLKTTYESCVGPKKSLDCQSNLLTMRSILRTRNITDAEDQETLADLVMSELSKKKNPNFAKIAVHAEKLLGYDPNNLSIQKLWAMSQLMSQKDLKNLPRDFKEDVYSKLDPAILDLPEFQSYRLFMEAHADPAESEIIARDFVGHFPDRSDSHEISGWSLWHQGRRTEALEQMRIAIQLNPQDKWLQEEYRKVSSPSATKEDYQGRMNLGVKLEDLFN